jgi:eukaryotic-like serine/threonine-protein kinase
MTVPKSNLQWFEHLLELEPTARAQALAELAEADPTLASRLTAMLSADAKMQTQSDRSEPAESLLEALAASALPAQFVPIELLGHGGMGEVWRATREIAGETQQIAVKLLRLDVNTEAMQARFVREQRALLKLDHPHIARLYDAGVSQVPRSPVDRQSEQSLSGRPWLAMELVEGTTILQYCDQHKLSVRERLQIFRQVLSAVQYAHDRLIVHRDIKPDNVFVTWKGQVKLLDFGIATAISGDTGEGLSAHTQAFFSAYAVAPEQLQGQAISVGTDVYALCGLLYDLLSGQPIFQSAARSPEELQNAVLHQAPALPSSVVRTDCAEQRAGSSVESLRAQLRGDLDRICLHGLRKRPEERYASVRALDDDVLAYLENRPVQAVGQHWRYRSGKWLRRNWLIAGVSAAALASAIVFVSLLTIRGNELKRANAQALAEKQAAVLAQQRAESAQKTTEQVNGFLIDVFRRANPLARENGDRTLSSLVEAAFAEFGTRDQMPSESAPLLLALVDALVSLGQVQNAKPLLKELTSKVALSPQQSALAKLIAANIASTEQRDRELEERITELDPEMLKSISFETFMRYQRLQAQLLFMRKNYAQVLTATNDMEPTPAVLILRIKSLTRLRRFPEAEALIRKAVQRPSMTPIEVLTLHELMTSVLAWQMKSRESYEHARKAYELAKQVIGEDNSRLLRYRNDYGISLQQIGEFSQARTELRATLAQAQKLMAPDDPRLSYIAYNIVVCDAKLGELTAVGRARLLRSANEQSQRAGMARALLIRTAYLEGKISDFKRMLVVARSELGNSFWDVELRFWDSLDRLGFGSKETMRISHQLFEFDPILNAWFKKNAQLSFQVTGNSKETR